MSYTIRLTGFTLGVSILNVDLYACTGSLDDCTNNSGSLCTGSLSGSDSSKYFPLVGYSNIPRSSLNGTYVVVPEGIKTIRVVPSEFNGKDGDPVICVECVDYNNLTIRMPTTPTPTPTPTPTVVPTATPTNTPTVTPLPATVTPLPATVTPLPATVTPLPATVTPLPATVTPLPATVTPTPTPECVISVGFEVDSAGDIRYIDCCGETIYLTFGIGPQVINDCLQYGSLSQVGATISFINYSATSCSCPTTPTPLPATATPQPTPFETTFSGYVSLVNGPTACTGGEYSNVNITVVGTSLCNLTKVKGLSSTMYGNVYGDMIVNDTFWVSDGTDEREFMRDGSAQTGTAQTACTACSGAPPTSTPLPPTPTPQTYDVYERCDLTAIYYVDYSAGNLSFVTINSECCSRIDTNKDSAYMATNYPSAIYFSSFTNVTCPCD
jgi:hypothetical protein